MLYFGLYVDRFPILSKAATTKLGKRNQDSLPSCLNRELKEWFLPFRVRKTQCVGGVRSLLVRVECLITELKHISLGCLKNFYWFPVGLKSRHILKLDFPPYPVSHSYLFIVRTMSVWERLTGRYILPCEPFLRKAYWGQQLLWKKRRLQSHVWGDALFGCHWPSH